MTIAQYLNNLNTRYKTGISREHSYRGDLQNLLEELTEDVLVTNEPARIECGAPDYILTKKNIPVGYIEAKDIGADLGSKQYKEQFQRYKDSLNNLIVTDYLDFWLYREGELATKISIAKIENGQIESIPQKHEEFKGLIRDFSTHVDQTIKSSRKLAKMMAGKAKMLATVIENALDVDEEAAKSEAHEAANITLREQFDAFKQILIHDIDHNGFANIYAQTIAYGMFAARLHDPTLNDFSRHEAATLIPKSNPFLRKLFHYIAGYDLDDRIKWIVDALADIFRATNVAELLNDFGKATQQHDPIIHFYETFLSEFDPKLRKSRGVWYTPEPVVNFIVRAVDDILKEEFDLKDGLADTSKTKIKVDTQTPDKRSSSGYKQTEREVHKVQILDPATGTGTFLAEIIKHIYSNKFEGQEGIWSKYVDDHLIPRLNGFEILMASYAMAHLKLDLLLTETGYRSQRDQRFRVYLTNSLEEHHPDTGTLFANWLSTEANEANHIKRDTPVMVVLGNPPYSVSSSNKSEWIEKLILDYKRNLDERNIQPLSDDYIKFIKYGEHFIEKNGNGILAYISNNSFIDGLIHRQMRKHLATTFDRIYIIDLHGNANRKEVTSDGSADVNVFDIQQGVSINIFIKTGKTSKATESNIYHFDILGERKAKYDFLLNSSLKDIKWNTLSPLKPNYYFVPKNFQGSKEYQKFISIKDLFISSNVGINTEFDDLVLQDNNKYSETLLDDLSTLDTTDIIKKYNIPNKKVKKVEKAKDDIQNNNAVITPYLYRPFDTKYSIYTGVSNGIMGRPRGSLMKHIVGKKNIGLVSMRQYASKVPDYCYSFISKDIVDNRLFTSNKGYCSFFPLYLYNKSDLLSQNRTPNLNIEIITKFEKKLNQTFNPENTESENCFTPINVLDYIYSILHSPTYREKYKEFLKIDFPRIPYPTNQDTFWKLVDLGGKLRKVHLLESPTVEDFITTYPIDGDNKVTRKLTKRSPGFELTDKDKGIGRVWINDEQCFDQVPKKAFEFYIGGYQPAEKWLKDRRDRTLSYEDILHYQKIIKALMETDRLMGEIDEVDLEEL